MLRNREPGDHAVIRNSASHARFATSSNIPIFEYLSWVSRNWMLESEGGREIVPWGAWGEGGGGEEGEIGSAPSLTELREFAWAERQAGAEVEEAAAYSAPRCGQTGADLINSNERDLRVTGGKLKSRLICGTSTILIGLIVFNSRFTSSLSRIDVRVNAYSNKIIRLPLPPLPPPALALLPPARLFMILRAGKFKFSRQKSVNNLTRQRPGPRPRISWGCCLWSPGFDLRSEKIFPLSSQRPTTTTSPEIWRGRHKII